MGEEKGKIARGEEGKCGEKERRKKKEWKVTVVWIGNIWWQGWDKVEKGGEGTKGREERTQGRNIGRKGEKEEEEGGKKGSSTNSQDEGISKRKVKKGYREEKRRPKKWKVTGEAGKGKGKLGKVQRWNKGEGKARGKRNDQRLARRSITKREEGKRNEGEEGRSKKSGRK